MNSVYYIKHKIEEIILTFTEEQEKEAIIYIINSKKRKAIDLLG